MADFENVYQDAHSSGLLPGVVLMAKDKSGNFSYEKTIGTRSLREGRQQLIDLDTILMLASCTKLMTAIAALQCVERGLINLDEDITRLIPEAGMYGILTGLDDSKEPIIVPNTKPITLRHLLSHTSGYQYDLTSPILLAWRASCGQPPYAGSTVPEKFSHPLLFEPGEGWAYGPGHDWAGKAVERATDQTLEDYMSENIWGPLGMKDVTFWLEENEGLRERMADLSVLNPPDTATASDAPNANPNVGVTDCLGGGGAYASARAFMTLLHAVLKRDPRLLKAEGFEELLRPQLDEKCAGALHELLLRDPQMQDYIGLNIPVSGKKNWSFAGIWNGEGYEGWMNRGTVLWGGMVNIVWFIDFKAGLCAFAGCQMMPPMTPRIMRLHERFQRSIYETFRQRRILRLT